MRPTGEICGRPARSDGGTGGRDRGNNAPEAGALARAIGSFCRCTLPKLQNAYTEDEYLAIDARVARDSAKLPKRVQKILRL